MAILLNPIMCFTAQDMYEHMPCYNHSIPSINQLEWPNVEPLLSTKFLRNFTLNDKIDELVKLYQKFKIEIQNLQQKDKTIDESDFDIVFEVSSPDSEEALFLEEIGQDLEHLFGVSNLGKS